MRSLTILLLLVTPLVAAERPNVLLILADDLGYSDIGCYGGEIATPNLDRLAANGVRLRQFYNSARCCPTRASLLTGLHPHQAGVGGMNNDTKLPGFRGWPQPNTVTIAEVLRATGYHTSMVGKWHLSAGPQTPRPTDRGFDEFYGMVGGFNSCFDESPHYTRLPEGRAKRDYNKGAFYSTDAFADYSRDFLAAARTAKKPFFQYLAFNAPHFPLHAKPADIAKYKDTYSRGWDALRAERLAKQKSLSVIGNDVALTPRSPFTTRKDFLRTGDNPAWDSLDADRRADLARRMAVFAAMVDSMDQSIGKVLDDLKAHGELDNTLVLFLSDNGACAEWDPFGFDGASGPKNVLHTGAALETMGGPGTYHSYGSAWANLGSTPFRLFKHYCHEGGIRTPCIAHWPAGIAGKGHFHDGVGHIVDVMATCVDVAGAMDPAERAGVAITPREGVSLRPVFRNEEFKRSALGFEHELNRAWRDGDWKLVAKANDPWELYNVKADPTEVNDLATKEPARVTAMAAAWDAWAARCHVLPHPMKKAIDK
jgi:arylsulfatase